MHNLDRKDIVSRLIHKSIGLYFRVPNKHATRLFIFNEFAPPTCSNWEQHIYQFSRISPANIFIQNKNLVECWGKAKFFQLCINFLQKCTLHICLHIFILYSKGFPLQHVYLISHFAPPACLFHPTCLLDFAFLPFQHSYSIQHVY